MEFNEILAELKKFEGTEDYKNFVTGLMNDDKVNEYLETENGKKALQPRLDSYLTKGLKTWQDNHLSGLVDAEVKKRFPEADPKDTELAAVKAELEKMKAESLRKDLTNKALTIATEKGLPVDLINYFIGTDEEATKANLDKLEKIYTDGISAAVEKKLKGSNYIPPEGDNKEPLDGVSAAFAKLNPNINLAE